MRCGCASLTRPAAARAVAAVERATDKIAAHEERIKAREAEVHQLHGAIT